MLGEKTENLEQMGIAIHSEQAALPSLKRSVAFATANISTRNILRGKVIKASEG
jgi:hypothetical protein